MPNANPTTYAGLLRETFSADDLEAMFWEKLGVLDKVESAGDAFTIGSDVKVPALTDYSGGYSVRSKHGGQLNPADHVKSGELSYELVYNWFQVGIEFGLLNQANGSPTSTGVALNTELTNALKALRRQVERQFLGNGDALIARCTTTSNSTEVELDPAGYGYDAIRRRWLYPGLPVDIGTTADEDSVAGNRVITAVERNKSAPSITVSGAPVTTGDTHYISIHGARVGTASHEGPGLRQIGGSTAPIGGVNPTAAGNHWWLPAYTDTSTTSLSLELLTDMQDAVFQETGEEPTDHVTSRRQESQYYLLLQTQTRFAGDSQSAGESTGVKWNGIKPTAVPSVPDREWHMTSLKRDFIRVYGKHKTPIWMSQVEGTNKGLRYNTGHTDFGDSLGYALNIVPRTRNGTASAIGLTD